GTKPNLKKINQYVEESLMLVTALSPVIGSDKASKIAHYAKDNDLTVLNILESVCCRPKMLASASEAALFRSIDEYRPTVLLDEAEALLTRTERVDYLRAI